MQLVSDCLWSFPSSQVGGQFRCTYSLQVGSFASRCVDEAGWDAEKWATSARGDRRDRRDSPLLPRGSSRGMPIGYFETSPSL